MDVKTLWLLYESLIARYQNLLVNRWLTSSNEGELTKALNEIRQLIKAKIIEEHELVKVGLN